MDLRWSNDGVTMEYLWRKGEETTRDLPPYERRILRNKNHSKKRGGNRKKGMDSIILIFFVQNFGLFGFFY